MEDTEQNRRLHAASEVLANRIIRLVGDYKLDHFRLNVVEGIILDHRAEARRAGLDFPELAIFPLVRQGRLELARKDLDLDGVRTFVLNLTVKYPTIRADEIANALAYAWPGRKDLRNLDLSAKTPPPKSANSNVLGADGVPMRH
jgi:hypothetical protein